MTQTSPRPVAIVGGGITGLSAAFRLQQEGVPFVLYEASGRTGGYMQTLAKEGYTLELGPNTILETSPKITQMIRDLGLESARRYTDSRADCNYVVRRGRLVPLPRSPLAFASSRLFSAKAKLRLIGEPFIRRAQEASEESVADFVVRRLGREFLDYAINPFVSGIYAGDPKKLSVQQAFPKLHEVEQKYGSLILGQTLGARERKRRGEVSKAAAKKFSFDNGLQQLPDSIFHRLQGSIQLNAPVTGIRKAQGGGWILRVSRKGEKTEHEHSAVLLTAPAHRLATMCLEGNELLSLSPLSRVEHAPIAVVHLGFCESDVQHHLNGFGFLIPEAEQMNILGATFSTSIFADRAPKGQVLLTSFVGGCRNPGLVERSDRSLVESTVDDLRRLLGVRSGPVFQHVTRFPAAIPQYNLGYSRFKTLFTHLETHLPGVFFAGTFRDGISVANAICAGHDAAARILPARS